MVPMIKTEKKPPLSHLLKHSMIVWLGKPMYSLKCIAVSVLPPDKRNNATTKTLA
jgi:hypothetical protein